MSNGEMAAANADSIWHLVNGCVVIDSSTSDGLLHNGITITETGLSHLPINAASRQVLSRPMSTSVIWHCEDIVAALGRRKRPQQSLLRG